MKSPKDRDLAQELVDFLLKDEGEKKAAKVQAVADLKVKTAENVAPSVKAPDEIKTIALQPTNPLKVSDELPDLFQPGEPTTEKPIGSPNLNPQPPIEFDLDLGDGDVPDVDFNARSNKAKEALSKNTPTAIFDRPRKKIKRQTQGATQSVRLGEDTRNEASPSENSQNEGSRDENVSNENSEDAQSDNYRNENTRDESTRDEHNRNENTRNEKTFDNIQPPADLRAAQATRSTGQTTERAQAIFAEVNSLLGGVEAIKVAQARISQLEQERDRLREEIEKLLFTTDDLKKRVGELLAAQENQEKRHRERIGIQDDEKLVLKERHSAKEQELSQLKRQHEELQGRFQSEFRKIRVRERELENRQELLKADSIAVIHSKDEIILELKRQLEQLHFEIDNFRAQSADMNAKISEFYDRNNRTVKALRLALSVLEVGDQDDKNKKASGS